MNQEPKDIPPLLAAPAVGKKKFSQFERPGRLKSDVQLCLNTADSQILYVGNHQKSAVGLLQFGSCMAQLWKAAAKDDPYADYYLLKVYDAIMKLRHQLAVAIQDYEHLLSQFSSASQWSIQPFVSEKPVIKTLWFRTPYGYLGANLIAEFDRLLRIVITMSRIGIVLEKSYETIRDEWLEKIAAIFKLPLQWEDLKLTRAAIVKGSGLVKTAKQLMGKLPEAILTKQLRSPLAPIIEEVQKIKSKKENEIKEDVST